MATPSPIVANIYMEAFEKQALETSLKKPNLWVRYMDDIIVTWPHEHLAVDEFLSHLNSQHSAIQFTIEKEIDQNIKDRFDQ